MNDLLKQITNDMIHRGLRTRSTPVDRLTNQEEDEFFDSLCEGLMRYGQAIGIRVSINNVKKLGTKVNHPLSVQQDLAAFQLHLYQLTIAHGFGDTIEDVIKGFLAFPTEATD